MAEWGLQAIIRPNPYDHDNTEDLHYNHVHHHQSQHLHHGDFFGSIDVKKDDDFDQALVFCFPHLFDQHRDRAATSVMGTVVKDELDHLYNPLYSLPAHVTDTDSVTVTNTATANDMMIKINMNHHYQEIQQDQEVQVIKNFSGPVQTTPQLAPKPKKRKNQQKRVVVQVTADGLASDPWAWRKYGQKPIKGSIYPRSYYRCSSSKVCMARRQVEQSCTDSSIYILTYTADHNHPQPTRRNSLAGINRSRYKAAPKSPTNSDTGKTVTKTKTSPFHSPTTVSTSSVEDEVIPQSNIKQETMFCNKFEMNQAHAMLPEMNDIEEDYMAFSDDFFEGLDDLEGYKMEASSYYNTSNQQFPDLFC